MALPSVLRRGRNRDVPVRRSEDPFWSLQNEVNRLFEDFWHGSGFGLPFLAEPSRFHPSIDVAETESEVRVTAELPGLEEKDFELHLAGDQLMIRGEKRTEHEESGRGWHSAERAFGSFQRAIQLPCEVDADKASAEYKNGVLTVRLPKQPGAAGRRITVESG